MYDPEIPSDKKRHPGYIKILFLMEYRVPDTGRRHLSSTDDLGRKVGPPVIMERGPSYTRRLNNETTLYCLHDVL